MSALALCSRQRASLLKVVASSASIHVLPTEISGPRRHPLIGLVDDRSEYRAAIPRLLSAHGIAAIPFAGVGDLPPLVDNAVLLVADVDKAITEALRRTTFGTRIVAYAEKLDLPRVVSAIQQGANNYVLWPETSPLLVLAVRDCMQEILSINDRGHPARDPCEHVPQLAAGHRDRGSQRVRLTRRESEILKIVSSGSSSCAIGKFLKLSSRTIECHRSNIIRKLGVTNMTEAVWFALRHGMIV